MQIGSGFVHSNGTCGPHARVTDHRELAVLPINERIIRINAAESERFLADASARARHWAIHPTFFAATKCMDGRVHLPNMTGMPTGLVKEFRAKGGAFEVFWPAFIKRLDRWVDTAMRQGSRCFVFVTEHYSESDPCLGCAGWKQDRERAREHMVRLRDEMSYVFGEQVTVAVTTIETDQDNIVVQGPAGIVSGDICIGLADDEILALVRKAFPREDTQTLKDLTPFLAGNARHVAELSATPRTYALAHDERVIAVGQEFSWIPQANLALVINDADPNLDGSIEEAAKIVLNNLRSAEPGDDATLFVNVPYAEPGRDRRLAETRAHGLLRFAEEQIRERVPKLWGSGRLHKLVAVTFEASKRLEVLVSEGPTDRRD